LAATILCTFLLAALACALQARAEEPAPLKVGDLVPDFTLRNGLAVGEVNFASDIKGKAAVSAIVFFNTGCSACLAELDEVCKAAKDLGDEKLRVYAIAVDKRGEQSVKAYYEIYKYPATYLLDPTFTLPPKFGFTYTPASLLVDREGRIVFMRGGYDPIKDNGVITREITNALK
jgi:thiol-disulfide isomerase/thioredoxin